eukprot:454368_1
MDGGGFGMAAVTEEPDSKFVKLVSSEGAEFFVERQCAMISGTIKAMIQGNFVESKGLVNLSQIRAPILEKIVQYMYYKLRYTNTTARAPEFPIEPEIALELIVSSSFLDC